MEKEKNYNVVDEYDRVIESGISLKRAQNTKKLNPGANIVKNGPKFVKITNCNYQPTS